MEGAAGRSEQFPATSEIDAIVDVPPIRRTATHRHELARSQLTKVIRQQALRRLEQLGQLRDRPVAADEFLQQPPADRMSHEPQNPRWIGPPRPGQHGVLHDRDHTQATPYQSNWIDESCSCGIHAAQRSDDVAEEQSHCGSLSGIPGAALTVGIFTTIQTTAPAAILGRVVGVLLAAKRAARPSAPQWSRAMILAHGASLCWVRASPVVAREATDPWMRASGGAASGDTRSAREDVHV